jgi:hydrogenase nickel incorporation protein HypA/HybF
MTMHEYSILCALFERVEEAARAHQASAVRRVRVRIGALAGVEPELLRSAYSLLRERSICQDAELEICTVEARWECARCARCLTPGGILRCPACGAPARLVGGDEIILDQIAMEVP